MDRQGVMRRFVILVGCLALVAAACGGGSSDGSDDPTTATTGAVAAGDAANGESLFAATCAASHGANGENDIQAGNDLPKNRVDIIEGWGGGQRDKKLASI